MKTNQSWSLAIAAVAGVAFAGAVALQFSRHQSNARRTLLKAQRKADLHEWENEGGSVVTPATYTPASAAQQQA